MIYDLDKIDHVRYDKFKKTIYMSIYDTVLPPDEAEKHSYYFDRKIEMYVNYILCDGLFDHFSLKEGKKYKYVIQIVMDFAPTQQYIEYLKSVNVQVIEHTKGQVKLSW
ncbi:MAG: hypothetical protein HDT42_11950 [Ruminococcaceae bacterium]|nr:hypothetical protein [Oscillospiraceae bacterium]